MHVVVQAQPTKQFRLAEDFLSPYRVKGDPFKTLLARSTYLTKYCRGGEAWTDTIRRAVEGNMSLVPDASVSEAELLFHLFWTGQALPPGRSLWVGGVEGIPADARFNCWYVTLRSVDDWCWAANQLMLGGGVGVGLGEIRSLPPVKDVPSRLAIWCRTDHENVAEVQPNDKAFLNGQTPVFAVPDSREGWVEALRRVLTAAFGSTDIIIDVSQVRPRGRPIRTFGGTACGPGPLTHMLRSAWQIVRSARGRCMSSVEALDVTNHIGLCIKSGNVRRSALIVLGSASDCEFRSAKKDWEAVRSHRHTSNNSIAFRTWGEIATFDWAGLVDDLSEYGEPGILNLPLVWHTDPQAEGVNPCFTGDTRLATQFGLIPIRELASKGGDLRVTTDTRVLADGVVDARAVGTTVRDAVPAFQTADAAEVYRITTVRGYSLRATKYHKFPTPNGTLELQSLSVGDTLLLQSGVGQWGSAGSSDLGTVIGWLEGDGGFSREGKAVLRFQGERKSLADLFLPWCSALADTILTGTGWQLSLGIMSAPEQDSREIVSKRLRAALAEVGYRVKGEVPEVVWRGSRGCAQGYLRGLFGAAGQVNWADDGRSFSMRLLHRNPGFLRDVQVLLVNFGIVSAIYRWQGAGWRRVPDGKGFMRDRWCEGQFDLCISGQNAARFAERVGFLSSPFQGEALEADISFEQVSQNGADSCVESFTDDIASIEFVGTEPTYCTTQPSHHTLIAEGIVTGNCGEQALHNRESCNLAEIFPAFFESEMDQSLPFKLVTRYTLRQRLSPLSDPISQDVGRRNMRIGVSLGGICDFDWTPGQLSGWFGVCRDTADAYAEELGVSRPITTTTVKPSGCRPWYALTATDQGIFTLEELFEAHPQGQAWAEVARPISALHGDGISSAITKTYDNGTARVLRLRMSCGLEVESTENHQWWVSGRRDQGEAGWVRADHICLGDVLGVRLGVYNLTHHSKLVRLNRLSLKTQGDAADICQPDEICPDLAWLFGYFWGSSATPSRKYWLRFVDQLEDNLRKAQRILFERFGLGAQIHPAPEGCLASVLEVESKMLWHWLVRNDVWKYCADAIPCVVRSSAQEDIIAFIAGLVDSGGSIHGAPGKVEFTIRIKDTDFAHHLQNVCWTVGLGTECSLSATPSQEKWLLTSTRFIDPCAFTFLHHHSVRCAKAPLDAWCWQSQKGPRQIAGKVEAIEDIGEMPTYDVEVEGAHWYYAGSVKSHNTISLLNGSSPGIHAPHAPYYIRRVRIAKNDRMVPAMLEAGVPFEYDIYDKTENTLVFSFPMKAPHTKVTVQSQTLRDQFARQAIVQEYWADNAVSSTLSFTNEEKPQLAGLLAEFVPRLKSTSCLAKAHGYAQAPYEEIDEATWRALHQAIQHDHPLVRGGEMDDGGDCAGGVCPVK